jgi:hypothetical protein
MHTHIHVNQRSRRNKIFPVSIYTHVCIHTYTHTPQLKCSSYPCTYMHAYIHTYTAPEVFRVPIYIYTYMHAHIHTYAVRRIHIHICIYTYTHTPHLTCSSYPYTYMHAHIHTYTAPEVFPVSIYISSRDRPSVIRPTPSSSRWNSICSRRTLVYVHVYMHMCLRVFLLDNVYFGVCERYVGICGTCIYIYT